MFCVGYECICFNIQKQQLNLIKKLRPMIKSSAMPSATENVWVNWVVPMKKQTSIYPRIHVLLLVTDTSIMFFFLGLIWFSFSGISSFNVFLVITLIVATLSSKANLILCLTLILIFKSGENCPIRPIFCCWSEIFIRIYIGFSAAIFCL